MTWPAALLLLVATSVDVPLQDVPICNCVCATTTTVLPAPTSTAKPMTRALTGLEFGLWVGPNEGLVQGSYVMRRWRISVGVAGLSGRSTEGLIGAHYTFWEKKK